MGDSLATQVNATQDVAMPDSNVILSMLFPQEEPQGNRNRRLLDVYQRKVLARIVLVEIFFQAEKRIQQVWEILRKWYHGSPEYLYARSDPQSFKDTKKNNIRRDLRNTKALTSEQIENILFNLEKERPAADVDKSVKEYLDYIFSKLKTECSDYRVCPTRFLFPSHLTGRSLSELVDFWITQSYRPFHTGNKEIQKEIESNREMRLLNDALRALGTRCPPAGRISPDDRKVLAEYMMIRDQIRGSNLLYLLTADELLRLLGVWSQLPMSGFPGFNVISTQGTKKCLWQCPQTVPCPILEY